MIQGPSVRASDRADDGGGGDAGGVEGGHGVAGGLLGKSDQEAAGRLRVVGDLGQIGRNVRRHVDVVGEPLAVAAAAAGQRPSPRASGRRVAAAGERRSSARRTPLPCAIS